MGFRDAFRRAALAFADALGDPVAQPQERLSRPAPVPPPVARAQAADPTPEPEAPAYQPAAPVVSPAAWAPPAASPASDPLTLMRRLGLTPIDRPFFKRIDRVPNPSGIGYTERPTDEDTDIPVDDETFAAQLKLRLSGAFGHLQILDSIDVRVQLPRLRSAQGHDFFPACGVRGVSHSWGGQTITPADLALADVGWIRYVASAKGLHNHPAPDYGGLYEGYVAVGKKAAPWNEALAVAQAAGVTVIANPEVASRYVLIGNRTAAWLLTFVKPSLRDRMTEFGLDVVS